MANTITLDHGAVEALQVGDDITFKTGDLDLVSVKPGDHVRFEIMSNGINATLAKNRQA